MLLLLPVAYLLAAGRWWALLIPLATAVPVDRDHAGDRLPDRLLGRPAGRAVRRGQGTDTRARRVTRRFDREALLGLAITGVSALIYWLANRQFDAGRGDFFYLADAFLHGHTWLDIVLGPYDVIHIGRHFYVPFAPFPAVALMPLVALVGPVTADQWESGVNALLAAAGVGMCWWLLGRIGAVRRSDRIWLTVLFGFSTQILWVTTRGGVWHTGHLIATILTLACLIELWGRQRAFLIGLLAGAAFLTRAPLALRDPVLRAPARPETGHRGRDGPGRVPGAHAGLSLALLGLARPRRRCRRSSPSSPTTRSGSGRRSSRATRWPRSRRSSRRYATRACSRSATSR